LLNSPREVRADSRPQVNNLCSMEINQIKPFFSRAMGVMGELVPKEGENQERFSDFGDGEDVL
jgi:hypothetical protein